MSIVMSSARNMILHLMRDAPLPQTRPPSSHPWYRGLARLLKVTVCCVGGRRRATVTARCAATRPSHGRGGLVVDDRDLLAALGGT